MADIFTKQKCQEYLIFDLFNEQYGDSLVQYCDLLRKFKIEVMTVEEYKSKYVDFPIESIERQPFASFIIKNSYSADTTNAGVVYNKSMIDQIKLNETEQLAVIAHEIGHIIYFFFENKEAFPKGQGEEIFCDRVATRIGLTKSILSAIEKVELSGLYKDTVSRFGMRKLYLKSLINFNLE